MNPDPPQTPETPNQNTLNYSLLRHIGLILDELSSQGLEIWQDEQRRWCWRWFGTEIQSERSFLGIGEAIVDAVITRYPIAFDSILIIKNK